MKNISPKLVLTSLILSGIASTNIEAAWLRSFCSRAVAIVHSNTRKLGMGVASTGSVAYGFWPFSRSSQQNSAKPGDQWKHFDIEVLDGERSYLIEYIRNSRKHHKTSCNIFYGFPTLNKRFSATHPYLQVTRNLTHNKETGRDALPSVIINMEKCKIHRGMGIDSSTVRVACKERGNDSFFDYLFQPVGKVYNDQHQEVILEARQDIEPERLYK